LEEVDEDFWKCSGQEFLCDEEGPMTRFLLPLFGWMMVGAAVGGTITYWVLGF